VTQQEPPGATRVAGEGLPTAPSPRFSRGLVTTYFAVGLVLLLVGVVTVVYLSARLYSSAAGPSRSPSPRPSVSASPTPSVDPHRVRLGPERLAMGKSLIITGEDDAKFQVTVKAGKFRRTACDIYSVKPKNGGYLPARVTVKVLEGEPDISSYAFRFQKPDGTWLPPVGGSGCDKDYGAFVRRLSAGRTYATTLVYDIPRGKKGDIVFVWPILDVAASWHLG
jgi:hypothetical protein